MMNYTNKKQRAEILGNMAREINQWDGSLEHLELYNMEWDFDELMQGKDPWEIARSIHFGDFRAMDDYWNFDGYGNLQSYDEFDFMGLMLDSEDEIIERYTEIFEDDENSYIQELKDMEV